MSYKLLVADFDGTLRRYEDHGMNDAVLAQLTRLLKSGVALSVSSGRTYGELVEHFGSLAEHIWFTCCDGACTVKSGKIVYDKRISREALALFDRAAAKDRSCILHGAFGNYVCGTLPTGHRTDRMTAVPNAAAVKEPIYKVTTFGAPLRLPAYCDLRMHWDGGEDAMAQYVNRFANKGAALSDLQMRLMLTKFETACIGDSGNDIAMMHNAKLSVCVGTRCPELAAVCTAAAPTAEAALGMI